jgi:stearoyl-CoA desaturase (Delta-9 desaturase)
VKTIGDNKLFRVVLFFTVVGSHVALVCIPLLIPEVLFPAFFDIVCAVVLYLIAMIGVELGNHRGLVHHSYRPKPIVQTVLAIMSYAAFQGPIFWWAAMHRRHHARTDKLGDPHSPVFSDVRRMNGFAGLYWSQIGWLFANRGITVRDHALIRDLIRQPQLVVISNWYIPISLIWLVFPGLLGLVVGGSWVSAARAFYWGSVVRLILGSHAYWAVNSVCHSFGSKVFVTKDESRNVNLVAWLTLGAGLHNCHHAFPRSYRLDLLPGLKDPGAFILQRMATWQLISDLVAPTDVEIHRRVKQADGASQLKSSGDSL